MNDELSTPEQSSSLRSEDKSTDKTRNTEKIRVSIDIDSEIMDRIKHLTKDPSKVIETAIKQWLNGERNGKTDLTRTFQRNPPVPPQGEWND